jgi:hypothetical protein
MPQLPPVDPRVLADLVRADRSARCLTATVRRSAPRLLGLRQLSHWLSPERAYPLSRPLVQRRIAELSSLLDDRPAQKFP